ncbi:unnamed protein product [Ectocarpus sp. 12 AP-2014]
MFIIYTQIDRYRGIGGMPNFRLQRENRRKELEKELSKLNLMLRYDSRLCSCYINGTTAPEWTAPAVAKECATMHWLHNFTDYQARCAVAATVEATNMFFHSGRHFADHMKRRVYPAIKESILAENDGGPETWPWVIPTTTTTQADQKTTSST